MAVLTPQLAQRPDLVSRCLLNTIITNFFIASGYAMLHASCLYHQGRGVLLMATHNSGKSTTALRLALAGYPLLSDSMIFLTPGREQPQLLGFPVGRIKLRRDMIPAFPQVQALLAPEMVRGETKHSFDLRQLDPDLVCEEAAVHSEIDLCLLARGGGKDTQLCQASRQEVEASVMENSLFLHHTFTKHEREQLKHKNRKKKKIVVEFFQKQLNSPPPPTKELERQRQNPSTARLGGCRSFVQNRGVEVLSSTVPVGNFNLPGRPPRATVEGSNFVQLWEIWFGVFVASRSKVVCVEVLGVW